MTKAIPLQAVRDALLHSYRALLIPRNLEDEDVEAHAARGMLPALRLKATNAERAAEDAHRVSGKRVLRVERVEAAA